MGTPPASHGTLRYGPVAIGLGPGDPGAFRWLVEVLQPCFTLAASAAPADWCVHVSATRGAYEELVGGRPPSAAPRACFALDQEALALPTWAAGEGFVAVDAERSCALRLAPARAEIVGDPRTRRWRFTAMWVCHEIAATRLRRTHLEIHAASVETAGRAVLFVGPKGAGKTTLSLHLLRGGGWRAIANDRAFLGHEGTAVVARGMPTAVKLRPATLAEFPELSRGLPPVKRPYLYTLDELAAGTLEETLPDLEAIDLALSPAQIARQVRAGSCGAAPAGAVVFPEVRAGTTGWAAERLNPDEVACRLRANLYGGAPERRGQTLFEDLDGGRVALRPSLADELADAVPGYRLAMASRACAAPGFGARLRDALALR
jgi:hypothetical protein